MKIVRFLLLPTLVFSFSATLLEAMELNKPNLDQQRLLRNNYYNYPCIKQLLLLTAPLCYSSAEMNNEGDVACCQLLPYELQEHIKRIFCLIARESLLSDLITWGMVSQDVLDDEAKLRTLITQLVVNHEYPFLEVLLNAMRRNRNCMRYSIIAHDRLVAMISKLVAVKPQDIVEKYFATLPEGTLKMAVRFVYAIKEVKNLDEYNCAALFCPDKTWTCLTMVAYPCEEGNNKHYLGMHLNLSKNSLCTQEMIPAVFGLLQPVLIRMYPSYLQVYREMARLKTIDVSGNEYDASSWSYLLPKRVQLKIPENLGACLSSWGLGPVRMLEEPDIDAALFDELAG